MKQCKPNALASCCALTLAATACYYKPWRLVLSNDSKATLNCATHSTVIFAPHPLRPIKSKKNRLRALFIAEPSRATRKGVVAWH